MNWAALLLLGAVSRVASNEVSKHNTRAEKDWRDLQDFRVQRNEERKVCFVKSLSQKIKHGDKLIISNDLKMSLKSYCGDLPVRFLQPRMKPKRNGEKSRKRRQAPPRRRYRGQTQTQYIAFNRGNQSEKAGTAEAIATPDISRATVSGVQGMGQAQSQSGVEDPCDELCSSGRTPGSYLGADNIAGETGIGGYPGRPGAYPNQTPGSGTTVDVVAAPGQQGFPGQGGRGQGYPGGQGGYPRGPSGGGYTGGPGRGTGGGSTGVELIPAEHRGSTGFPGQSGSAYPGGDGGYFQRPGTMNGGGYLGGPGRIPGRTPGGGGTGVEVIPAPGTEQRLPGRGGTQAGGYPGKIPGGATGVDVVSAPGRPGGGGWSGGGQVPIDGEGYSGGPGLLPSGAPGFPPGALPQGAGIGGGYSGRTPGAGTGGHRGSGSTGTGGYPGRTPGGGTGVEVIPAPGSEQRLPGQAGSGQGYPGSGQRGTSGVDIIRAPGMPGEGGSQFGGGRPGGGYPAGGGYPGQTLGKGTGVEVIPAPGMPGGGYPATVMPTSTGSYPMQTPGSGTGVEVVPASQIPGGGTTVSTGYPAGGGSVPSRGYPAAGMPTTTGGYPGMTTGDGYPAGYPARGGPVTTGGYPTTGMPTSTGQMPGVGTGVEVIPAPGESPGGGYPAGYPGGAGTVAGGYPGVTVTTGGYPTGATGGYPTGSGGVTTGSYPAGTTGGYPTGSTNGYPGGIPGGMGADLMPVPGAEQKPPGGVGYPGGGYPGQMTGGKTGVEVIPAPGVPGPMGAVTGGGYSPGRGRTPGGGTTVEVIRAPGGSASGGYPRGPSSTGFQGQPYLPTGQQGRYPGQPGGGQSGGTQVELIPSQPGPAIDGGSFNVGTPTGGIPGVGAGYPGGQRGDQGGPAEGSYPGGPGMMTGGPGMTGGQGVGGGYPAGGPLGGQGTQGGYPAGGQEIGGMGGGYPGGPGMAGIGSGLGGGYPAAGPPAGQGTQGGYPAGGQDTGGGMGGGYPRGPGMTGSGMGGGYPAAGPPAGQGTQGGYPAGGQDLGGMGGGYPRGPGMTGSGMGGGYPAAGPPAGQGAQGGYPVGGQDTGGMGGGYPGGPGMTGIGSGTGGGYPAAGPPGVGGQGGYKYDVPSNQTCPPAVDCNVGGAVGAGETQAQSSVHFEGNETSALASSQGKVGTGVAQTQVSGTYTGSGSFSAQAQTSDSQKSAQSQIQGNGQGATSTSQGTAGKAQTQAQVQVATETGATLAESQTNGAGFGTNTQVQAGTEGGMADAQSKGPGATSSQAQIGFLPYDGQNDNQKAPFKGGGTASAQSSGVSGQSQSQIQGTFKYGISYTGAAQAGSGATKDLKFPKLSLPGSLYNNTSVTKRNGTVGVRQEVANPQNERLLKNATVDDENQGKVDLRAPQGPTSQGSRARNPGSNEGSHKADFEDDYEDDDYEDEEEDEVVPPMLSTRSRGNRFKSQKTFPPTTPTTTEQPRNNVDTEQNALPSQTQQVIIAQDNKHDTLVIQDSTSRMRKGEVFRAGEEVPGSGGYKVPTGFRGRVTSVAGDKTETSAPPGGQAQSQTVVITPGSGQVRVTQPPRKAELNAGESSRRFSSPAASPYRPNPRYAFTAGQNGLRRPQEKSYDGFVTVTNSVTGQLKTSPKEEEKKYAHTYYTKSSTCGYFTFTCTAVSGSNGRTKICKPRPQTNPDGTPCF